MVDINKVKLGKWVDDGTIPPDMEVVIGRYEGYWPRRGTGASVFVGVCDLSGRPVFKARKLDDHAGTAVATEIEGDATTDNHFAALVAQHGAEAISNEWGYEFASREPLDPSIPLDLEPRL